MKLSEAIDIVAGVASTWGENKEEGFAKRISPTADDAECRRIAKESNVEEEEVIEVRDLWIAIELLGEAQGLKEEGSLEYFNRYIAGDR